MTIEDQPPPIAQPERVPVWDLVINDLQRHQGNDSRLLDPELQAKGLAREVIDATLADMRERDRVGRERYGTPLTTHNGRDHLVDAYQEALDGVVYLRAHLEEGQSLGHQPSPPAMRCYVVAVINALTIRGLIMARDYAK